jgi:hypothetical protein
MKRTAILTAIVAFLLLGTIALAQSGGPDLPTRYTIRQGAASGGGYRLTGLTWQVSGTASGGGYRLLGPASPALRGNGCCCTYMPCLLRNHQEQGG